MEKTYKEYLEEILCSKISDDLTGAQKQALDAVTELFGLCNYERLCELAKADKEGRCVIDDKPIVNTIAQLLLLCAECAAP